MAFSDTVDKLMDAVLFIYFIGWIVVGIGFVVVSMLITKMELDKTEYNDGEKAGIYIGVFILSCLLSIVFGRYLPYMIAYVIASTD